MKQICSNFTTVLLRFFKIKSLYQLSWISISLMCTNFLFFSFQRKPYKLTPSYKQWPALKNRQKWRKIYFYLCLIWLDMVGYFWLYCLSGLCQQIILWLDGVIFSVDSLTHLMVMLLGKYQCGRRIRYS